MTLLKVNYAQILKFNNTIEKWKHDGDLIYLFFNGKIKDFWNDNRIRVQHVLDKQVELDQQFFQHDEDGFFWEGEGENRKALLKPGVHISDYEAAAAAFLNKETTIEI